MTTHTPSTAPSIVSVSTPGELVATVPYLVGFRPRDSVVAISLRGQRSRAGLVLRLDLPPESSYPDVARLVAAHLARDGAAQAILVVYPTTHGIYDRPCGALVDVISSELTERRITVRDALLVHDGRWASYLCDDPVCCPPDGTEVVERDDSPVAAAHAVEGRVVLDDRADLARLLESDDGEDARAVARALAQAPRASALAPRRTCDRDCLDGELDRRNDRWAGTGETDASDGAMPVDRVAVLAFALRDPVLRDHAVARCLRGEPDAYESLWLELTRRLPAPLDAVPATLLAITAYARGDGAFVRTCLERAQASDPGYSFADLLTEVLDGGTPPADVLRVLRTAYGGLEITDKAV
ncbi:MAG: DUF4192 domain-containing protein [Streptosporangiales bacterium]